MLFDTEINGIPCQCHVLDYREATPMVITGIGFGDCIPPDPEEFDYELLDSLGNKLDLDVSNSDTESLIAKYETLIKDDTCIGLLSGNIRRRYREDLLAIL